MGTLLQTLEGYTDSIQKTNGDSVDPTRARI
jgi:hypothetical protein